MKTHVGHDGSDAKWAFFIPSFKQKHQQFKTTDGFSRR